MRLPGESPVGGDGDDWTLAGARTGPGSAGRASGTGVDRADSAPALGAATQRQAKNEIAAASSETRRPVIRADGISSGR